MGDGYSYVGSSCRCYLSGNGQSIKKNLCQKPYSGTRIWRTGGIADLVHFFNKDGLGAIVKLPPEELLQLTKQEKYAKFGEANYADASRQGQ